MLPCHIKFVSIMRISQKTGTTLSLKKPSLLLRFTDPVQIVTRARKSWCVCMWVSRIFFIDRTTTVVSTIEHSLNLFLNSSSGFHKRLAPLQISDSIQFSFGCWGDVAIAQRAVVVVAVGQPSWLEVVDWTVVVVVAAAPIVPLLALKHRLNLRLKLSLDLLNCGRVIIG